MKKNNILSIVLALVFLAVFIGSLIAIGHYQQTALPREKYIEAPKFCYIECGATASKTIKKTFGAEEVTITCSKDSKNNILLGTNDGCILTLSSPDTTAFFKRSFVYKINGGGVNEIPNYLGGGYSGEEVQIPLDNDDYVTIAYGVGIFDDLKDEGQSYTISGNPFALYNYNSLSSRTGQILDGSRVGNCYLEDNYYKSKKIDYFSPEFEELKGTKSDFTLLSQPYGRYTYMCGFTPVPSFDNQVEIINGEETYCMDNSIYKILDISVNGYTYNVVNYEKSGFIKNVPCCNGDEKPNNICVNHNWITQDKAVCDLSKGEFCPQSIYQPYGESQYKRYECIKGQCQPDIIDVVCNDASDCGDGEVCIFSSNPEKNYCVQSGQGTTPKPTVAPQCSPLWKIGNIIIIPNLSIDCLGITWFSVFLFSMFIVFLIVFYPFFSKLAKSNRWKWNKGMIFFISFIVSAIITTGIYYLWWVFLIVFGLRMMLLIFFKI